MLWRVWMGSLTVALTLPAMAASEEQLNWELPSGVYRCADGEPLLGIERAADPAARQVRLHYRGQQIAMQREDSSSGLPRYESKEAGLLLVDLPWKSVLVNTRTEKPVATDCTHEPKMTLAQLAPASVAAAPPSQRAKGKASTPRSQASNSAPRQPAAKAKPKESAPASSAARVAQVRTGS